MTDETTALAALLQEEWDNADDYAIDWDRIAARLIAAGVRVAPSDKDAMEGVACDWDEDGNCRCVRVALSPTEAMGAAAMAEYMASWSGVAPSPTNLGQQTVYSTSLGERIVGFIEHGYTCGECNWGRANQPRSLSDYVAHVNAEHPIGPHRDFPESRVAPSPEHTDNGLVPTHARRPGDSAADGGEALPDRLSGSNRSHPSQPDAPRTWREAARDLHSTGDDEPYADHKSHLPGPFYHHTFEAPDPEACQSCGRPYADEAEAFCGWCGAKAGVAPSPETPGLREVLRIAIDALEDAREWLASRAEAPEVQKRNEAAQEAIAALDATLAPSPETPGLREAAQAYLDAFDMPLTTDPEVHYDTLTAAREALRAALASPPAPAGLDVAWAEAEAAMVEWAAGANLCDLTVFRNILHPADEPTYTATATRSGHPNPGFSAETWDAEADGRTPAEALLRLAANLAAQSKEPTDG